jgi:GDP-L-fucose synthase
MRATLVQRCFGDKRFIPVIPSSAYEPNGNFNPKAGRVLQALMF